MHDCTSQICRDATTVMPWYSTGLMGHRWILRLNHMATQSLLILTSERQCLLKYSTKQIASNNTPKSAIEIASQQQGGELEARGLNKLPKNIDQMKNYRRSEAKRIMMCSTQ